VRPALAACARNLTGKPAAGSTQRRKRSVFYNALGYTVAVAFSLTSGQQVVLQAAYNRFCECIVAEDKHDGRPRATYLRADTQCEWAIITSGKARAAAADKQNVLTVRFPRPSPASPPRRRGLLG
jgi:hypothetical protein